MARPWKTGTSAQRAANSAVSTAGDLGTTTDTGDLVVGDGTTLWSALKRLVRVDEVTTAVQQYVTSLVVTNSNLSTLAATTGYVYAIVDSSGKIALGVKPDGNIVAKYTLADGQVTAANLASDVALPQQLNSATAVYEIVDLSGRTPLYVTSDGSVEIAKLGARTVAAIQAVLAANGVGPAQLYKPTYQAASHNTSSGPDVACFGDSLTAGAGGNGTTYPGIIQTLMTAAGNTGTVRNAGVGGETSVTIAARTNAVPLLLLPVGGSIPTSGPVTVTMLNLNGWPALPLLQGSGGGASGILWTENGPVPGSISLVQPGGASTTFTAGTDYYQFTRTTAGLAVTCARPSAFRYDFGEARRDDIYCIWIGQNNPTYPRAETDALAIVQHMAALNKRFLVIGKPTNTAADDALWHDQFGRRYFAVRDYLITYGLQDAGITPTSQDSTDISSGIVPTSLISPTALRPHLTPAGYTIVGTQMYLRLQEYGWVL